MVSYEVGEVLTEGDSRVIHYHRYNKKWIVKKRKSNDPRKYNSNTVEWEVWNLVKGTKYEEYFCPCLGLSEDEKYLVMEKAQTIPGKKYEKKHPLKSSSDLKKKLSKLQPKKLPKGIKDVGQHKLHNHGLYKGRIVIVDYGDSRQFLKYIKKYKFK